MFRDGTERSDFTSIGQNTARRIEAKLYTVVMG